MCSPGGVVPRVIADYIFLRDWISLLTRHLIKLAGSIPQCIKICKSSSYNRTLKGAASIVHGGIIPSIINSMLLYTKIPLHLVNLQCAVPNVENEASNSRSSGFASFGISNIRYPSIELLAPIRSQLTRSAT